MLYTIYKPNAKNAGGLASFRVQKKKDEKKGWESLLFVELLPQKSWNNEKRTGSFDKDRKKHIMLNISEAGEFINTFRTKTPFSAFHKNGNTSTSISLTTYNSKRKVNGEFVEQTNFGLMVRSGDNTIKVPISPGEAESLIVLLQHYMKESMSLSFKNEQDRFKQSQKEKSDAPKEADDDIPF